MSDDINSKIAKIINEDDIWFNLMSLKQKFLVKRQMCDNCHTQKEHWTLNGKCHHTICHDCIDSFVHSKNTCPKCKIEFNSEIHLSTSNDLKRGYSEIEQFVWKIMALKKGTLRLMPKGLGESSSNNSIKTVNSLSTEILQENDNFEPSDAQLTTTLLDKQVEVIEISESENSEFSEGGDLAVVQLNAAENDEMLIISHVNNTDEINNLNDELRADNIDSEDDIFYGATENSDDLYPVSSTSGGNVVSGERIILSHSNLNSDDLKIVKKFVDFFNVELNHSLDDSVTHLVVQTAKDNTCKRTQKYLNALLSHCCIVSMNWIKDCLVHEKIMPEIDHIPIDSSTQQAALMSWKVGKGHIKSPMEWTKDCILFFHNSIVESHSDYPNILALAKKANFVIADCLEEFNDQFKLRFILVDLLIDSDKGDLLKRISKHNALPISLDWLIECLGQYRFVPISSEFHVTFLNALFVKYLRMDKSYFVFDG